MLMVPPPRLPLGFDIFRCDGRYRPQYLRHFPKYPVASGFQHSPEPRSTYFETLYHILVFIQLSRAEVAFKIGIQNTFDFIGRSRGGPGR